MNTKNQVSYSFKEKYFNLEKEKRINRRQYFVRAIIGSLIFGFLLGIIAGIFQVLVNSIAIRYQLLFGTILGIIGGLFYLYKVALILIDKRAHDYGSDGKIESISIQIFIYFYYVVLLIAIIQGSYIQSEFFPKGFFEFIDYVYWIFSILFGLYLMLRPGNTGKNSYGEDTTNVKIGFLG